MEYFVFGCAVFFAIGGVVNLTMARQARESRSLLIRQNLVYLVAFVNYFDWLTKNYAPGVIATLLADKEYVKYMKKNGLPEAVFSGIVEHALQKSNDELIAKTNEVMEAIKQPLSAEISALLED